jgi:hypothetical protein
MLVAKTYGGFAMNSNPQQHDEGVDTSDSSRPDDPAVVAAAAGKTTPSQQHKPPYDDLAGDLLVGAGPIEAHLKQLGVPDPDAYYLRRSGKMPIGKYGANLIASKRRLARHTQKLTAPTS